MTIFESACTMGCQLLKFDDGNAGLTFAVFSDAEILDVPMLAQHFAERLCRGRG